MEDKIQEHEMGVAENEDANMEALKPFFYLSHQDQTTSSLRDSQNLLAI